MTSYPFWMTIAFAIGVGAGVLGCILLLLRKSAAFPVLLASLLGNIVLYIGDITQGVFAALGAPQVVVLISVVLIVALLLWLSRHAQSKQLLRS